MRNSARMLFATICLVLAFTLTVQLEAQDKKISKKDVPAAVLSAFQKAYPNARIKNYLTETEGGKMYYEIESTQGKTTLDALLLPDGTFYEMEEGIAAKDLPAPVSAAVSAKYPDSKIMNVEKTTRGTDVTYDLKLATGKTHVGLTVDPSGKILHESKGTVKKETKEEKEKD